LLSTIPSELLPNGQKKIIIHNNIVKCLFFYIKEESMKKDIPISHMGIILILGSVWGLSEAALGFGIQKCAALLSGSIMTGVALIFLAAGWFISKRIYGIILLVVIASAFKLFDALLLSLPIRHGAVANPVFAFILEGAAFIIVVSIIKEKRMFRRSSQALAGGGAALMAAGSFPLVKYATGVSACVFPGTAIPLSIYYAPLAVLLSMLTVPVGFWIGERIKSSKLSTANSNLSALLSPIALLICLAIVVIIRLA
jgi:hypothetical protein